MQIIKLQNNTRTTVKNDEKWDRKLRTKSKILTCFGLSRVVHMPNAWKNVGFRSIALKNKQTKKQKTNVPNVLQQWINKQLTRLVVVA